MKNDNGDIILCNYGCGKEANYIMPNGKYCCSDHWNKCSCIRQKNRDGLLKAYKDGRLNQKETYKHLPEETRNKMAWSRGKTSYTPDKLKNMKYVSCDVMIKMIKNHIIDREYECSICKNKGVWNGKTLVLEVHHIDGNHHNNDIANLVLLCPNCHSQTDNYRNKLNYKKHKKHIFVEKVILENISKYNYDIDKLIKDFDFKNKSKVYSKYFELLKQQRIILPTS